MADGSNGTVGVSELVHEAGPIKLRRPRPLAQRFVTPRGVTPEGKPYGMAPNTILPPPDYDLDWKREHLDTSTLGNMAPSRLLELLMNLSPEMSKGAWDYMRLLNPGWSFEVLNPGSDTPNARGRAIVEEALDRIKQKHGSVDVVLGRLHMGAYMRGGYFAEAVFDDAGRELLDIATPDPASVRFRVVEDPETKRQRHQLGQWQNHKFVPLDDEEGISYIPVDPFPGNPYGRPLIAPAMFSALFLIGLLHDLRRVISQQGWPRIHIQVLTQKILDGIEADGEAHSQADVEAKLEAAINAVRDEYARLQPDDAYITGDEVDIKGPVGVTAGANLTGVEGVIEVVERMLVRALKTMPLVLGITDGVSEANANRQWEILISGVKALQHLAESMLERFFELACRMQGVQANVVWEFAEIRAAEAQRDALTRSQEIDNIFKLRDGGIIDQEEAAMELVGHPPALEEAPTLKVEDEPETDVQDTDENPEPGTANAALTWAAYPSRLTSDDSGARMVKAGYRVGVADIAPLRDAQGLLRPYAVFEDGTTYRLIGGWHDETGEMIRARYRTYTPARAVPAPANRHPVGGGPDDGGRDGIGRGSGAGAVRPRRAGSRRAAGRNAGLRGLRWSKTT
jgi:hypothetical protein